MSVIDYLKNYFNSKQIPDNYEICPGCDGTGLEDVFIDCEYCNGVGAVSPQRVFEFNQVNKKED